MSVANLEFCLTRSEVAFLCFVPQGSPAKEHMRHMVYSKYIELQQKPTREYSFIPVSELASYYQKFRKGSKLSIKAVINNLLVFQLYDCLYGAIVVVQVNGSNLRKKTNNQSTIIARSRCDNLYIREYLNGWYLGSLQNCLSSSSRLQQFLDTIPYVTIILWKAVNSILPFSTFSDLQSSE